jgi:hypothetical protein
MECGRLARRSRASRARLLTGTRRHCHDPLGSSTQRATAGRDVRRLRTRTAALLWCDAPFARGAGRRQDHGAVETRARIPWRIQKGDDAFLAGTRATSYIVYRGDRELEVDGTRVLPLERFLRRLYEGEIIG